MVQGCHRRGRAGLHADGPDLVHPGDGLPVCSAPPGKSPLRRVSGAALSFAAGLGDPTLGLCHLRLQRHRREGDPADSDVLRPGTGLLLVLGPRQDPESCPGRAYRQPSPACDGGSDSMNSPTPTPVNEPRYLLLERITAGVLLLVVLTVSWIVLAAYQPLW